jgi:hypothetical protein
MLEKRHVIQVRCFLMYLQGILIFSKCQLGTNVSLISTFVSEIKL